jgi:single-stranded-DNA-specific exonuclease
MDKAARRLTRALSEGQKILLYGDYDVDGATAVVILKTAISLAGGEADFHVPHRIRDGYGMRGEIIEAAAANGIRLIISVDTGIRAVEVVRRAGELGIDVIVTDHHLPENELPPALAVLNPRRQDCSYPYKDLCGAGVALKLAQALFVELDWPEGRRRRMAESFLKLAAIATVADVVPLTGENRIIVKHGLEGLRQVRNPGLQALLETAGFAPGEPLRARAVAFRLAPRLNAAGRMDDPRAAIELFLSQDASRVRALARQLDRLNEERRAADAAIEQAILDGCVRQPVTGAQRALVFSAPGWNRGVIGIVAGRLAERFHRPVFVLSEDPESGEAHGSGRSAGKINLVEALESMSELFLRFGGHSHAAGLALPLGRVSEFRERLAGFAAARISAEDLCRTLEIETVTRLQELNNQAFAQFMAMEPFGQQNPAPVLALLGCEVAQPPEVFAERHLKIRVRQDGQMLLFKGWNMGARAGELTLGCRIDVAFDCASGEPAMRDFRAAGSQDS